MNYTQGGGLLDYVYMFLDWMGPEVRRRLLEWKSRMALMQVQGEVGHVDLHRNTQL
jgi:hypothetical protein